VKYFSQVNGNEYEIELQDGTILVNGEEVTVDLTPGGVPGLYSFLMAGQSHEVLVESDRADYTITLRGESYPVYVEDERTRKFNAGRSAPTAAAGGGSITAPIPGLIVKVLVEEGETVEAGQPAILLEAMKMENEIRVGQGGIVKKVEVTDGQRVEQNATLVVIE